MKPIIPLLLAALTMQLFGCTAAVVGGGATGAAMVHDRRTAPTMLEDQAIEIKSFKLLLDQPEISDYSNISITSYNLKVLLSGEADTPEVSNRFAELVSHIQRVEQVHNEIVVGPSGTLLDQTNDAYLTSKVKFALLSINNKAFDPTRVKVVTSQGTVFLMGIISRQDADLVTNEVRYVTGVKRVVKIFEYL
ncbi:21 kDa hemolysin precursor [hydrothermal vent metagenome]|uniref:21 kDa hemolysin n=1 Tax=hydrothermal vent metagenome TaxID=652676 RepID=A0A3B1AW29_9ZZZZ